MIDHTGVGVSDFHKSKTFYLKALAPLGYQLLKELPTNIAPQGVAGLGVPPFPDFWVTGGQSNPSSRHIAFRAASRAQVDAFYQAAMAAGGRDNGPPGIRAHYHPNYYGAFVLDPDGYNIEAVCHGPAG
jgi:catechol 2,3-dioxygenase-like lactoylglutathione lyase family enzyme